MGLSLDQENAQHDSHKSDDLHEVPAVSFVIPWVLQPALIAGGESCGSLV
jgi:hypothetical protein